MSVVEEPISLKADGRSPRPHVPSHCLGAEIDRLAGEDHILTKEQATLAKADFDGHPQIIRGVAGSGKTVVLANNLAKRVAKYSQQLIPEGLGARLPKIGVVCFNRCLVPFIFRKAKDAYSNLPHGQRQNCSVMFNHINRFMFHLCTHPRARAEGFGGPFDYQYVNEDDPQDAKVRASAYLSQAETLKPTGALTPYLYDTIYLDEGQDLEVEEYQLLLELIRPHPATGEKNLIVFYDDAQNIYARPRPKWADLGLNVVGLRSRIMKECHRNTRQVVEFAFNVLVGKCAGAGEGARGIDRFADTTTLKGNGLISETDSLVKVHFAKREGARPTIKSFTDAPAEVEWVAQEVARLLDEEHVRPQDILILFEGERWIQGLTKAIRVKSRSPVAFSQPHRKEEKDEYIVRPGRMTVTTTRSAKGYDGGVVFVVGTDVFPMTHQGRASFYVGCTRARLRLYVSGIDGEGTLFAEAKRVSQVLSTQP